MKNLLDKQYGSSKAWHAEDSLGRLFTFTVAAVDCGPAPSRGDLYRAAFSIGQVSYFLRKIINVPININIYLSIYGYIIIIPYYFKNIELFL